MINLFDDFFLLNQTFEIDLKGRAKTTKFVLAVNDNFRLFSLSA